MAMDYLTLGPTPCGEACEQIGPNFDSAKARREMVVYIAQLKRQFPEAEAEGVKFAIKSFPHDFGSYSEVCVVFNDLIEEAVEMACHIENNLPEYWDAQATAHMPTLNPS